MAQGMGAFAQGLVNGYTTGRKMQQDKELHDLRVEKAREEKEFKEQLKLANQDLSPVEQFTVSGPDGATQIFDSQDAALKAMEGGDGFQLSRAFMVGDQSFNNAEQAEYAARVGNSEVGKMSRQAKVAMDFGQPQMAAQLAQAATQIRAARTSALTDMALSYKQSGNIDGLLNMYDQQAGDGGKSRLVEQDGQYMLVRDVNGRTVPLLSESAGSIGEVFDLAAMGFSTNHGNIVDIWKFNQTHGLNEREFADRQRHNKVSEGISAGNLAVAQANLGLRQTEHKWAEQDRNNPKPTVQNAYDAEGQVRSLTTTQTRGSDGSWGTQVEAGTPMPGVYGRPPTAGSELDALIKGALGGQPGKAAPRTAWDGPEVDGSGLKALDASRGARSQPNQGGLAPAAPATPPGRFGDRIPDVLYENSPGLRMTFPRSSGGGN